MGVVMTKEQVKAILDRVLTWPDERQEAAVEVLLELEAENSGVYEPTDEEWAAIQEGLEQAERGELFTLEQIEARWNARRG
jgi:hypothetical protein